MPAPTYDRAAWPIFHVRLPRQRMSDADWHKHLEVIERLFQGRQRFALLIDALGAPPPFPKHRKVLGDKLRTWVSRDGERLAGLAVVLSSPMERGVFTAINWVVGQPYPNRTFSSVSEASLWLREMLGEPR